MHTALVTVTLLGVLFDGAAAVTYLTGHDYPRTQADMKGIPRTYVPVLGALLAAGTLGLPAGLAVPALGTLAACGLILYSVGAIIAHLRVGSRNIVGGIVLLATAPSVLVPGTLDRGALVTRQAGFARQGAASGGCIARRRIGLVVGLLGDSLIRLIRLIRQRGDSPSLPCRASRRGERCLTAALVTRRQTTCGHPSPQQLRHPADLRRGDSGDPAARPSGPNRDGLRHGRPRALPSAATAPGARR
ncbi:DoxX family protein [Streptomyces sp. I6]|nr:DoxX family protein [Streptomyces sp. I6]